MEIININTAKNIANKAPIDIDTIILQINNAIIINSAQGKYELEITYHTSPNGAEYATGITTNTKMFMILKDYFKPLLEANGYSFNYRIKEEKQIVTIDWNDEVPF